MESYCQKKVIIFTLQSFINSDDELTPNCNCEKCARKTCPCVTAKYLVVNFAFVKLLVNVKTKIKLFVIN